MKDIVDELRTVYRLDGDTYSSAEVLGMLNRAADEIEILRNDLATWVRQAEDNSGEAQRLSLELERLRGNRAC